jgi:hypothetical protein
MGGGGSREIRIEKGNVIKPNVDKSKNIQKGLSIKTSEGCTDCELTIDPGVSASSVKITINPRPDAEGKIPTSATVAEKVVPNIYRPSNSITLTPSAPFTGSYNPGAKVPYGVQAIWWDTMEIFWGAPLRAETKSGTGVQADACLIVRSEQAPVILMIPIQRTVDGSKKGVKFFNRIAARFLTISGNELPKTSYDPAKDPRVADDWKKLGSSDENVKKTVKKTDIDGYIKYASGGHYDTGAERKPPPPYSSAMVDTGADWALSSLVTGKEAYYTWINTVYSLIPDDPPLEERMGAFNFITRYLRWSPAAVAQAQTMGNLTPRVIYFQEPVYMLETDFAALRGSVDARSPNEVVQSLSVFDPKNPESAKDPNHVYYSPACCGAEGSSRKSGKSPQSVFAKAITKSNYEFWTSTTMQWIISAVILILMFLFLSWFLTYITEDPNNIFAIVGRTIRPRSV